MHCNLGQNCGSAPLHARTRLRPSRIVKQAIRFPGDGLKRLLVKGCSYAFSTYFVMVSYRSHWMRREHGSLALKRVAYDAYNYTYSFRCSLACKLLYERIKPTLSRIHRKFFVISLRYISRSIPVHYQFPSVVINDCFLCKFEIVLIVSLYFITYFLTYIIILKLKLYKVILKNLYTVLYILKYR